MGEARGGYTVYTVGLPQLQTLTHSVFLPWLAGAWTRPCITALMLWGVGGLSSGGFLCLRSSRSTTLSKGDRAVAKINGEEVKPLVSVSCEAETKKKRACPNKAHSMANGKWLCHIHNPEMLFRKQVAARREDYAAGRIASRKDRRNARITDGNVTSVTSRRDAVTHGGRGKPPNIVIIPRSEDGHDAGPNDGSRYFGIHKPCTISMTAGKA